MCVTLYHQQAYVTCALPVAGGALYSFGGMACPGLVPVVRELSARGAWISEVEIWSYRLLSHAVQGPAARVYRAGWHDATVTCHLGYGMYNPQPGHWLDAQQVPVGCGTVVTALLL